MLVNAGIPVSVVASNVDEPLLQEQFGQSSTAPELAKLLANAKAEDVASRYPSRLVLGSDQTLELDGKTLFKAASGAEAKDRLRLFSGRHHHLHSAFCFVCDGDVVFSGVASAKISIRSLSDAFIDTYLDMNGGDVLTSVAVYEIEALGIQMIESIDGDWFTIQGLPLTPVMGFLQRRGLLLI